MARRRKTELGSEAAAAPRPPSAPPPLAAPAARTATNKEVEPVYTLERSEEVPSQLLLTLVLPGVEGAPRRRCSRPPLAHLSRRRC